MVKINSETLPSCDLECETSKAMNTVLVQPCHPSLCTLNGFQEIQHRLPQDIVSKLPLDVTISLCYELSNGGYTLSTEVRNMMEETKQVTLPFHQCKINILRFVKPAFGLTSLVRESRTVVPSSSHLETALVELAKKRPTAWKMKERVKERGAESTNQYSTFVPLSRNAAQRLVGKGTIFRYFLTKKSSV